MWVLKLPSFLFFLIENEYNFPCQSIVVNPLFDWMNFTTISVDSIENGIYFLISQSVEGTELRANNFDFLKFFPPVGICHRGDIYCWSCSCKKVLPNFNNSTNWETPPDMSDSIGPWIFVAFSLSDEMTTFFETLFST